MNRKELKKEALTILNALIVSRHRDLSMDNIETFPKIAVSLALSLDNKVVCIEKIEECENE